MGGIHPLDIVHLLLSQIRSIHEFASRKRAPTSSKDFSLLWAARFDATNKLTISMSQQSQEWGITGMCCPLHATQKPNYSMLFGINNNSSFQHVSTIALSRASMNDSWPRNATLQPNPKCTFQATKARNGLYLSVNRNSLLPAGSCVPFSFTLANEQHSPQTLTLTPIPASTSILAGFLSKKLCIQRPCTKCQSLFMPLHLFVLLYPWSLRIFPNPVNLQTFPWTPEKGLCACQMAKAFLFTEAFLTAVPWSLKYRESSRPFSSLRTQKPPPEVYTDG